MGIQWNAGYCTVFDFVFLLHTERHHKYCTFPVITRDKRPLNSHIFLVSQPQSHHFHSLHQTHQKSSRCIFSYSLFNHTNSYQHYTQKSHTVISEQKWTQFNHQINHYYINGMVLWRTILSGHEDVEHFDWF